MNLREIDFEPTFKKEISNIEIAGIEHILNNMSHNEDFIFYGVTSQDFGLAYTSSSIYAMYNVTEKGIVANFEKQHIVSHFGITENDMLIVVCDDEKENIIYYEIESKYFFD